MLPVELPAAGCGGFEAGCWLRCGLLDLAIVGIGFDVRRLEPVEAQWVRNG